MFFLFFYFFLLKTNLCKYISDVNVGSRWVYRVTLFKAVGDISISTVSYM